MHGANGKTAELRPASIKGVLRFWWRAIHGNLPLKELKEKEGEIFGSMDKKSKLIIFPIEVTETKDYPISPTPHHREGYCSSTKQNCFHFNKNTKLCKKATLKTAKIYDFTLKMMIKPNLHMTEEQLKNLFILATTLGGFGQRSRRGFGSVKIIGSEVLTSHEEVETLIKTINPKFNKGLKKSKEEQYPYIRKIEIGKNKNNIDDLLYKISKATHDNKCGKALFKDDRLASPIYVSILEFGENDYRPIIITLNCVSEKYVNFKDMLKRQKAFKEAILNG